MRDGARIELGLRSFLDDGNFKGFTTNFQDLHGLKQLPGLAVQRLMADGYGFGGEGDWKTCALVRAMKVIAADLKGGTSFMEDYTYHLSPKGHQVLGSHMLEVCESIAAGKPKLEIHPLGIGGKEDPVRLVFDAPPGNAINASVIDLGNRFRMIVNEVKVVKPQKPLPKLPVARAALGVRCPISRRPMRHGSTQAAPTTPGSAIPLRPSTWRILQRWPALRLLSSTPETEIRDFKQELRQNEVYYHLAPGLGRL